MASRFDKYISATDIDAANQQPPPAAPAQPASRFDKYKTPDPSLVPTTSATGTSRSFKSGTNEAMTAAAADQPQGGEWAPVTWSGTGKAAATGGRNLVEGTLAAPGDAPGMVSGVTGWILQHEGIKDPQKVAEYSKVVEDATRNAIDPMAKIHQIAKALGYDESKLPSRFFPTSQDIASVTDPIVSTLSPTAQEVTRHKAENPVEGITQGTVEFLPGLLSGRGEMGLARRFVQNVAAPAVGSEVGGEVGKQMGNETLGRLIGGLGMGTAPQAGFNAMTGEVNANRANLIRTMQREGVDLTGGQATGKKWLQYLEAGPFATKPQAIADRQQAQLNRAATRHTGYPVDDLSPATIEDIRTNLGNEYDTHIQQIGGLPLDHQLTADLVNNVDEYHRLKSLPPNAPTQINHFFQRISDAAQAGGGVIPADVFNQLRSDISTSIRKLHGSDPTQAYALRDFQDAFYDNIERNASPQQAADLRNLNNRYRNMKIIEKGMRGAGEATAEGNITPLKLRSAVEQANPDDYLRGRGDLAPLARAAGGTMHPLPQSGTAPRLATLGGFGIGGGALHAAAQGDWGTAAALAGTAAVPPLASSILTSGPVSRAIIANALHNPQAINPMVVAMLARQASGGQ